MTTAEKLVKLCESRKWDVSQLGDVVPGISPSTLYNWTKGRHRPDLISSLLIAREFKVSLEWLADDADEREPGDAPTETERQVRRIVDRKGWDWVYWRLIEVQAVGEPDPKTVVKTLIDPARAAADKKMSEADAPDVTPKTPKKGRASPGRQ